MAGIQAPRDDATLKSFSISKMETFFSDYKISLCSLEKLKDKQSLYSSGVSF